jgi:transposase
MARPQIEINKEHFENLCNLQCTLNEIAGFFKCSPDTIENWCKRTYEEGFTDTYKRYSQNGKISLRRLQFKLAEKNASMAIWLGKQYLGQTDVITAQTTEDFVRNLDSIYDKLKNPAKNRTIEEMED